MNQFKVLSFSQCAYLFFIVFLGLSEVTFAGQGNSRIINDDQVFFGVSESDCRIEELTGRAGPNDITALYSASFFNKGTGVQNFQINIPKINFVEECKKIQQIAAFSVPPVKIKVTYSAEAQEAASVVKCEIALDSRGNAILKD